MRTRHTIGLGSALGAAMTLPAQAADLTVKLELPEITTGIATKPYVALFIEKDDDTFVRSLSLWHKVNARRGGPAREGAPGMGGGEAGDRYMSDLRDWWRSSGTTSQMPIDGVSSATRAAGTHEVVFTNGKAPLGDLPAGKYQLVVEVAREVKGPRAGGPGRGVPGAGGPPPRPEGGASKDALEELRIAFDWPAKKETTLAAQGKKELGAVSLTLKP
jgi:hypothetical protein